jgi:D-arabinose 1-dehydrogenase-like Zn-dependent alcohol dehydrogenase
VYNPLRNSGARPGDLVAVQGIGGLGHLGIQCARRMGFPDRGQSSATRWKRPPMPTAR